MCFPQPKGKLFQRECLKAAKGKRKGVMRSDTRWPLLDRHISPSLGYPEKHTALHRTDVLSVFSPTPFFPLPLVLDLFRNSHLFASLVSITSLTLKPWGKPSVSGSAVEVQLSPAVASSVFTLPLFLCVFEFFFHYHAHFCRSSWHLSHKIRVTDLPELLIPSCVSVCAFSFSG